MGTGFILSQVVGIIALVLISIGYFCKQRKLFLATQIVANVFYGLSFIFLNVLGTGILCCISIIRSIFLFVCEIKNYKHTIYFLPAFCVGYIVIGIVFMSTWLDVIPVFTSLCYTIGCYIKNIQLTRYIFLVPGIVIIIYSIICMAYTTALTDLVGVVILIIAIIKTHFENHKKIQPEQFA